MTRAKQKALLRKISQQVTAQLILHAEQWPEEWDGHDLRELLLCAVEQERTMLMMRSPARRRSVRNEIFVRNLY